METRQKTSKGNLPTGWVPSIKKLGWQKQLEVRKAVEYIHKQVAIANKEHKIEVHTDSFAEAHAVLYEAHPDATQVPGSGPKPGGMTGEQVCDFRPRPERARRSILPSRLPYACARGLDKEGNSLEGVLKGHETVEAGHLHGTVKHINVEGWETKPDGTKRYVDFTIYIDKKPRGL